MGNDTKVLEALKGKTREYRNILTESKPVINLISKYQKRFDRLSIQLGDKDGSLQKVAEKAQTILREIKQNHDDSTSLLQQSNSIYKQIETLLASKNILDKEIASTTSNLQTSNDDLEKKQQEISKILIDVKKTSELANQKHENIKTKLNKITDLELQYETLVNKLKDPTEGIEANIVNSKQGRDELLAIKEEGQKLLASITLARDNALKSKDVVEITEKESIENKNKILKHLEDSEEYKIEISKILSLASDSSLATAFKERKNTLRWTLFIWGTILISAVGLVSIPLIQDYADVSISFSKEEWFVLFLKFLVSTPLGLLALFASKQYTSERILQEKYAFKETVSRVHKAHILFLIEKFPRRLDEIFNFTKETVNDILSIPFDNKQTKIKVGLGSPLFGKFFNFTGEIEDINTLATKILDKESLASLFQHFVKGKSDQVKSKTPRIDNPNE